MSESGVVYVIDDDVSMCELIESALSRAGLRVMRFLSAEAFGGFEVVADSGELPCCILLDMVMPGASGLDFLEQRFSGGPPCPVIVITSRGSIRAAVKSMQLGAVDFLEKPFSTETLTEVVQKALKTHKGDSATSAQRDLARTRIAKLSPRERELLDGIVQGHSTKMIANGLGISVRTVDHHRANMMDKMQAANVADLVRMAVQADYRNVKAAGGMDPPIEPLENRNL